MKATVYKTFLLTLMVYIAGQSNRLFAQCTVSSNVFTEAFTCTSCNSPTAYCTDGGNTYGTYTTSYSQTAGERISANKFLQNLKPG
jgi:hypothetical protein